MCEDKTPSAALTQPMAAVPDNNLIVVWDVEGENRTVSGVTRSPQKARAEMLAALADMPSGKGRVRYAQLTLLGEYAYGATVCKARRKPGQNGVIVSGI